MKLLYFSINKPIAMEKVIDRTGRELIDRTGRELIDRTGRAFIEEATPDKTVASYDYIILIGFRVSQSLLSLFLKEGK